MKRLISVICIILTTALLASCNTSGQNTPVSSSGSTASVQSTTVTLPFSYADTLNPYMAATKPNRELSHLLYDSLFVLDENYLPISRLTQSYSIEGKTCTVVIKEARFTDGSLVSADDVVYSTNLAKAEGSRYASQLATLSGCTSIDERTVKFTFTIYDEWCVALLDYPIIKKGTEDLTDGNNQAIPPVGCGRYTFKSDAGKYSLVANGNYYGGELGCKSIELLNLPDSESLQHYLSSGRISLYFTDMQDGQIPGTHSTYKTIGLTNLLYLGVNQNSSTVGNINVRYAVSAAVDRSELCQKAFFGFATPIGGMFPNGRNSSISDLYAENTANLKQAVANLQKIDYNEKDKDGYLINSKGKRLTIKLLYNADNDMRKLQAEQIATSLKAAGIDVQLIGKSTADYKVAVTYGNYDLYIGEIKFNKNFDLSTFFTVETLGGGFSADSATAAAFASYYAGETPLISAYTAFCGELPVIPLCYRSGVLTISQNISSNIPLSLSDSYFGVDDII